MSENRLLYSQLVRMKRWADCGLYEAVGANLDRLSAEEASIMLRILDHILVVDRIFQHHLQGVPHGLVAPRSETLPGFDALKHGTAELDRWYEAHVDGLAEAEFDQQIDLTFTSGQHLRMRRGDILMHVCLHGTGHRGQAALLLQKNGIQPGPDRWTDFLQRAA